jgi:hypothetical protein
MPTNRRHGKPITGELRSVARRVPGRHAKHRPAAVYHAHQSAAHQHATESAGARLTSEANAKTRATLAPRVFTLVRYIPVSFIC